LAYASALVLALVAFALVSLAVVDAAQRHELDGSLESTARALRVIGDIDADRFTLDVKDRKQFHTIVDAKVEGAIVSATGAVLIASDRLDAERLARAAGPAPLAGYMDVIVRGRQLRVYAEPTLSRGRPIAFTLTWSDTAPIASLDRAVAIAFACLIPLVVGLAVLAGGLIAQRGLAPLQSIALLASEIEASGLSRRLGLPPSTDELGKLGATFDRMLDRLQRSFERERQFTNDASHELRAPLSVIRAEADLALRQERTPAAYREALEAIAAEADALEALTRELLAAARQSGHEDVAGPVDLANVATAVALRLTALSDAGGLEVEPNPGAPVVIRANRALIERAVLSVAHNALKYTPAGGRVRIRVAGAAERAELSVRDDGPGFSPAALQHAFDRFWRDDDAGEIEGSGLGLTLARTIVERYGGSIALANAEPHGALVRFSFPASNAAG
jgi:signal transduction histidine kinase